MGTIDGVDGDFAIAAFGSDTDEMRLVPWPWGVQPQQRADVESV